MKSVLLFPAAFRAMLLMAVLSLAGRVLAQPLAAHAGNDVSMCSNTSTTLGAFPAATGGNGPYQYSWSPTTGLNNPNIAHPICTATSTTTYTLTVSDSNSPPTAQDQVTVTVLPAPVINLSSPNAEQTTTYNGELAFSLCQPGFNAFPFQFQDGSSAAPGSTYSITWGNGNNGNPVAAGWSDTQNYQLGLTEGTYTIHEPGANGCTTSIQFYVFIGTYPTGGLSILTPSSICTGDSIQFGWNVIDNNPPGTSYIIDYEDGQIDTFPHPPPPTFWHVFQQSSCAIGGGEFSAMWSMENPCNTHTGQINQIDVSESSQADFTMSDDTVCVGTSVNFTDASQGQQAPNCTSPKHVWSISPATYNITSGSLGNTNGQPNAAVFWSTGSPVLGVQFLATGTYTVTDLTGNLCGLNSLSRTICVEAPPHAHFSLAPPGTCVPQVLNPVNTSSNPNSCRTTYQWFTDFTSSICNSTNGAAMTGSNTNTPQISISQAGGYSIRLRATNSCGFVDTTMAVNLATVPLLDLYPVGPLCAGDFVQPVVVPQACGTPIGTYTWDFDPGGTPLIATGQLAPNVQYLNAGSYSVGVSASSACGPGTDAAPLLVNPTPPSAQAAAVDSTLCQGQTLNLLANTITNATYQWSGPGFSSGLEDPSITNMPQGQFTYTVTPYLGICDGPPSSVTIDVAPADQITIPTPAAICVGDSAHLTANGSSNYSWTTSNGTPVGTGASIWVHPAATTTYIVNSGTNGNGCPGTQSVQVVVNQPTNVVTDANITVCDQAIPVQLNMSPAGGTWSDADLVNLNAATGVITPIPNSLGTDTLYYTFVNANNCTSTAQTIVTINNEVAAVAGPDVLKCEGDPVFNLGGAPAGGTWTGNITSFNPSTAGVFNLTYTYGSGSCQTTDALVITVVDTPNVVVNSFALCANAQPIQLPDGTPGGGAWSGNVNGGGPWTFDPASGTSILTYTVSLNGCTGSDTALAIVTPPPVADPGIDTVLCDQSIAFALVGNYGNAGTWTSTAPYFTNNPPQFTPVPGALGTWYATYTYTDAGGCTDADSVAITVGTTPQADAGLDNHVCENGGTVNYTGAPIGSWQSTAYMSSAGVFDPAVAGDGPHDIIYCTGVGTCANCDTAVVIVDAPPNVTATSPLSYCDYESPVDLVENPQGGTWSGSAGLTDANQGLFDPGLAALNANNLIYVYTDPNTNCRDTAFVTITINVEPVASFTNAAVACQYDGTFTFTGDNTAGNITSWQWNFGDGSPSATGQVVQHAYQTVDTVTVTLVVGTGNCTDTTTSTVMVWPAPVASLSLDTTSGCGPLTVQFTNNSTGPQLSYAWTINNALVSNNATFGPFDLAAGLLADTTYAIELDVSNQCGNASALDTVVVYSSPTAYFGPDFNGGCSPFPVHFINASVGQADSYTWDWGDGSATSSDTSIIVAHTFYTGANDTTYTVTLTATNQCSTDTHSYNILVHPNTITAFFNTDTTFGCAPLQVCFTQYSVGVTNWHWDFGFQNNLSNAQSPCFTYTQAGTFTATLFGDNGCSYDTVSVQITVLPSPPVTFTFAPDPVCGNVPVQFTNTTPDLAWCHWEFGDGDTSALTNPVHVYDIGNSYQVQLEAGWTQNTCTSAASATVTVYTVPQAVPGPVDSVFCAPHMMSATNGSIGQNLAYQWSLNNTIIGAGQLPPPQNIVDAGTYVLQLIVTDQISGCTDTAATTWVANPSPTSDFTLAPVDPCGRPALLDATSNSTSGSFLEWWLDDAFISAQNPLLHALVGEGVHELELVATLPPGGCTDTARTTFELYALPTAAFTVDTACTGHFIPLHDASIAADQEWWYYNGVYMSTDPFTHAMVPETVGLDTIALTVMSDHGCTDSTFRIVRVYPTSPSTFTPELIGDCQTVLLAPDTVMTHTGYHWTINYDWDSPDVAPTYYYDANSVANIPMMLIATTEDGCRDTTMSFFPIPDCVYVPNAFSPDGDGLNEGFVPSILPPEHFQYLQIFNRWGEMIADINSTRNPRWDGTYGGEPVEVGVYVWRLKLTSRVEPYIGHVTVLR